MGAVLKKPLVRNSPTSEISVMQALVHVESDRILEVRPTIIPEVGKGDILVEMTAWSTCGSDYVDFMNRGKRKRLYKNGRNTIAGHEGGGIVAALGKGVDNVNIGDLVALESHRDRPGYGIGEDPNPAIQGFRQGHADHIPHGTYSEYMVVPARVAFPIDEELAEAWPLSLWEPLGNGIHVCDVVSNLEGGLPDEIVISGLGPQGIFMASILKHHYGTKNLIGTEVDIDRMKLAESLGIFSQLYHPDDYAGEKHSLWIETSGSPNAIDDAYKGVKQGGNLVLFGLNNKNEDYEIRTDTGMERLKKFVHGQDTATYEGINLIGVGGRYERAWNLAPEIVREMRNKMDLSLLYTDIGPLSELPTILATEGESFLEKVQRFKGFDTQPMKVYFSSFN